MCCKSGNKLSCQERRLARQEYRQARREQRYAAKIDRLQRKIGGLNLDSSIDYGDVATPRSIREMSVIHPVSVPKTVAADDAPPSYKAAMASTQTESKPSSSHDPLYLTSEFADTRIRRSHILGSPLSPTDVSRMSEAYQSGRPTVEDLIGNVRIRDTVRTVSDPTKSSI